MHYWRPRSFVLPVLVTLLQSTPATSQQPPPIAEEAFLEQYAETYGFYLGTPVAMEITPQGDEVLFLRSPSRDFTRSLYSFDVDTGEERVLLTAEQVLMGADEELSDEERQRRERLRLAARGIASYQLSDDGAKILVPLSGRLFVVDRATARVTELATPAGYPNDAHFSPDATRVAYVTGGDLYVSDIASGAETRLTESANEHVQNGIPGFIAQEEMSRYRGFWWSPDGSQIAYEQTDEQEVEVLHTFDPLHPDAEPDAARFPRAGTTNARVRLGVLPSAGGETTWIEWDREAFPYLATVRWDENAPLTLVVQNRAQDEVRVLAADPETGATRTLLIETDEHWVNLDQQVPRWLDDGSGFLWTTERRGAWQLERRSADGALVAELTPADFGYDGLIHLDEDARAVWVSGSADPVESHVYRLPLDADGSPPQQMTEGPGVHGAAVSRNGATWIEMSRPIDGELARIVHHAGDVVGTLRSEAESPPWLPQPELVTVGERELRAAILRPRNFDRAERYPVLVSVYGGPGVRIVRAMATAYLYEQWLAEQGYIVVSIDGRGSTGRGQAWERAIAGNFIEAPLADQVAGLQALGERFPEMDLTRVGIIGWSFGGYVAAMAVMLRPDVFHAAIAGAPVTEWRHYDTHYTEHYMGTPQQNPEGYDQSSALEHAAGLERPLLIIHGVSDDNVYFVHAIALSDALLRAGRHHEILPLSGATHMVADPEMTRALAIRTAQFFGTHLYGREIVP